MKSIKSTKEVYEILWHEKILNIFTYLSPLLLVTVAVYLLPNIFSLILILTLTLLPQRIPPMVDGRKERAVNNMQHLIFFPHHRSSR